MTFFVENETDVTFDFDVEKLVEAVAMEILDSEQCPYESHINNILPIIINTITIHQSMA